MDCDDAGPVLDVSVLLAVAEPTGISPRELLEFFVGDTRGNLAELRAAFSGHDREAVHRHAHSLKSAAASVGASRLSARARALELASKATLDTKSEVLGDALHAAFAEFEAAVNAALPDLT